MSHIQLATDESHPVNDSEAQIGIAEGEEVNAVVNEVSGTEFKPMEMEKEWCVFQMCVCWEMSVFQNSVCSLS